MPKGSAPRRQSLNTPRLGLSEPCHLMVTSGSAGTEHQLVLMARGWLCLCIREVVPPVHVACLVRVRPPRSESGEHGTACPVFSSGRREVTLRQGHLLGVVALLVRPSQGSRWGAFIVPKSEENFCKSFTLSPPLYSLSSLSPPPLSLLPLLPFLPSLLFSFFKNISHSYL